MYRNIVLRRWRKAFPRQRRHLQSAFDVFKLGPFTFVKQRFPASGKLGEAVNILSRLATPRGLLFIAYRDDCAYRARARTRTNRARSKQSSLRTPDFFEDKTLANGIDQSRPATIVFECDHEGFITPRIKKFARSDSRKRKCQEKGLTYIINSIGT